jgi:hypothetical protein
MNGFIGVRPRAGERVQIGHAAMVFQLDHPRWFRVGHCTASDDPRWITLTGRWITGTWEDARVCEVRVYVPGLLVDKDGSPP